MRMFLVGMCDVFLLLYLTAVAELDTRRVSSLTVQDYVTLKESSEALEKRKQESDTLLSEREQALKAAQDRLASLERRAAELEEEKRRSAAVSARLEEARKELAEKEKELASLDLKTRQQDAERLGALQALERVKREAERTSADLAEKQRIAAESAAREEQARADIRKLEERRAAERGEAEKARAAKEEALKRTQLELAEAERRAKEAEDEAQRAKLAADEAAAKADAAVRDQEIARSIAEAARRSESEAAAQRRIARAEAELAKESAAREAARADQAAAESSKTKQAMQAIVQPAVAAYQKNIATRLSELKISLESEGLFGKRKDETALYGLPVEFNGERVVFAPLEQTVLSGADASAAKSLQIEVSGRKATRLYVSLSIPHILGVAVRGSESSAKPAPRGLSNYMPTLIAVRNGSALGFGDRLRKIGSDYFLFQRDRLKPSGGLLAYHAQGYRGTGDYAEYLVLGDQISDLDGRFIGVVADDNLISPISDLVGWRVIELQGSAAGDVVKTIRSVAKKR